MMLVMMTQTMNNMPSLKEVDDLSGKRVFLRGALNVPVAAGEITDDYRLQCLLPTITWLRDQGARIILAGHMSGNEDNSFLPVADYLKQLFPLKFITDYKEGAASDKVANLDAGEVLLFENLRQHDEEKANDEDFAKGLASYADLYVNDGFPAAHRQHASVVSVPKYLPAYAGLRFIEEVRNLSKALHPTHPFTFILGGAKFSTKLPLVEKFTKLADQVFVGGALANAYLKTAGRSVGTSRLPDKDFSLSVGSANDALQLPTDVVCQSQEGEVQQKSVSDIQAGDKIVDIGEETVKTMIEAVNSSSMVVWNGPLGWYEKGFSEGTNQLASGIAAADTHSILGGGDTAAVLLDHMDPDEFSFVSTAGGAMIDFLANETLPGIKALKRD